METGGADESRSASGGVFAAGGEGATQATDPGRLDSSGAGPPGARTLRLPQEAETLTTEAQHGAFAYRYAYARSADTQRAGLPGQDYLVVREDGRRLAFVLCDGVSQSFFGELASRLLGEAVLEWLWHAASGPPASGGSGLPDPLSAVSELGARLGVLVEESKALVQAMQVPDSLPPIVREVLEQKRALGSEANFVGGLLRADTGWLLLVWLGDGRLRLWNGVAERTAELGETFHTRERWSSHRGIVGEIHAAVLPLATAGRIAAYTDGLGTLDRHPALTLDNAALNEIIDAASEALSSDDISFLEVAFLSSLP